MATLTIKNIPDSLYHELKNKAARNHRSLNSEAIVSLVQAVHQPELSVKTVLSRARALRVKENTIMQLTNDIIKNAKEEGRS